jgi:hypothetical protein
MQDLDYAYLADRFPECHFGTNFNERELLKSAMDMYLYSLSIKEKLPEDLHKAMLLWSFDPKSNEYVKLYLEWVDTCEKRKLSREKFEKSMAMQEKIMKFSLLVAGLLLACVLIFN